MSIGRERLGRHRRAGGYPKASSAGRTPPYMGCEIRRIGTRVQPLRSPDPRQVSAGPRRRLAGAGSRPSSGRPTPPAPAGVCGDPRQPAPRAPPPSTRPPSGPQLGKGRAQAPPARRLRPEKSPIVYFQSLPPRRPVHAAQRAAPAQVVHHGPSVLGQERATPSVTPNGPRVPGTRESSPAQEPSLDTIRADDNVATTRLSASEESPQAPAPGANALPAPAIQPSITKRSLSEQSASVRPAPRPDQADRGAAPLPIQTPKPSLPPDPRPGPAGPAPPKSPARRAWRPRRRRPGPRTVPPPHLRNDPRHESLRRAHRTAFGRTTEKRRVEFLLPPVTVPLAPVIFEQPRSARSPGKDSPSAPAPRPARSDSRPARRSCP